MERITKKHVEGMFKRFVQAAKTAGAIRQDANVVLDGGNATYGYQYRMRDADSGFSVLTAGQDGLGCTAREAYNALKFATYAFDMLTYPA